MDNRIQSTQGDVQTEETDTQDCEMKMMDATKDRYSEKYSQLRSTAWSKNGKILTLAKMDSEQFLNVQGGNQTGKDQTEIQNQQKIIRNMWKTNRKSLPHGNTGQHHKVTFP